MPETSDDAGIRVFPPLVYFGALIVGYVIWWFWPLPILPEPWTWLARIVGIVMFAVGVWLISAAASRFRKIDNDPNPMTPTVALTFEGPYRFTRNPMYLGMTLILVGLAFVGNALWPLLAAIPVVAIIQSQVILKEERYLEAKFGAEYRAFRTRVRRWF